MKTVSLNGLEVQRIGLGVIATNINHIVGPAEHRA